MIKALTTFVLLLVALFVPPIHQDPAYHDFADVGRMWNVWTNFAFILVAVYAKFVLKLKHHDLILTGVFAVGLGSAYYHFNPTDATLVWDRLPMTVVFMALVAQYLDPAWRKYLIAVGVLSVAFWWKFDDLRLYALVQFGAAGYFSYRAGRRYWPVGTFYFIAKVLEHFDKALSVVLPMGGHPAKHIAAALAMLAYVIIAREEQEDAINDSLGKLCTTH